MLQHDDYRPCSCELNDPMSPPCGHLEHGGPARRNEWFNAPPLWDKPEQQMTPDEQENPPTEDQP